MESVKIKASFPLDIVYHLLAHLDLSDNPANLYSPCYVREIRKAKSKDATDLEKSLLPLQEVYRDNFQRLAAINFMPYYTGDIQSLGQTLLNYPGFTLMDRDDFIKPFFSLLEQEESFYRGYWERRLADNADNIERFNAYLVKQFSKIVSFFHNTQRKPEVYLSVSLTKYGRGFPVEGLLSAAVPLPMDAGEYEDTFLQIFHEYTHPLTDRLIGTEIEMSDDSHKLSELLAILADYYLLERLNPALLPAYLRWLVDLGFSEADRWRQEGFLDCQGLLPQELHSSLLDLLARLCR